MAFKISKNSAFKKWNPPAKPKVLYTIGHRELNDLIKNNKSLKPPVKYDDFIKWLDTLVIKNENGTLKILKG
jgi:hypothetical protein